MKILSTTASPATTARRRRRRLTRSVAVAAAAGASMLVTAPTSTAGTASAAVLPSEVCAVAPSLARTYAAHCGTNQPAKSYIAQFVVVGGAGFDITWTLPPGVATSCGVHTPCVSLGCHRGDDVCAVATRNDPQNDQYITVAATIGLLTVGSAAPASEMAPTASSGPVVGLWPLHLSSTAFIAASCGTPLCHTQ